jgi:hypothetical protein
LQKLEAGLNYGSEDQQAYDEVEEDAPAALRVLYSQQKTSDGEFDQRDGPVPEYLRNKKEFEGGAAAGHGYETGAAS